VVIPSFNELGYSHSIDPRESFLFSLTGKNLQNPRIESLRDGFEAKGRAIRFLDCLVIIVVP
jgi:hypothetical protein